MTFNRINYITSPLILELLRLEGATHYVAVTDTEYVAYRPSPEYSTRLEEKPFTKMRLDTPWVLSMFNNPPFGSIPLGAK